jgi:hypothetical protein
MEPDDDIPANDGGDDDNFPDNPINDKGQLSMPPPDMWPDIPVNDIGTKSMDNMPLSERFPDVDTNDTGEEEE